MSLRLFNIMAAEAKTRKLERCVNQVSPQPIYSTYVHIW